MFCKFCNASLRVECITARAFRMCGRPYQYAENYYTGGKDGYECLLYVCDASIHMWVVDCRLSVTGPGLPCLHLLWRASRKSKEQPIPHEDN